MLFCSEIIIHQKKGKTLIFMEKIDNFLVYVLMYDHVYIREYTGISRQTNARAPIVRTIVIARTVLAALVHHVTILWVGFLGISQQVFLFFRQFVKDLCNCVSIVLQLCVTKPCLSNVPKELSYLFGWVRLRYSFNAW